jgi:hypothetical protein
LGVENATALFHADVATHFPTPPSTYSWAEGNFSIAISGLREIS